MVLFQRTNQAGTRRYKGFMSYAWHHGDIDDINNEGKQRSSTTTITCDKSFKYHCENYPNFKHLRDIAGNEPWMTLRMIDPIE